MTCQQTVLPIWSGHMFGASPTPCDDGKHVDLASSVTFHRELAQFVDTSQTQHGARTLATYGAANDAMGSAQTSRTKWKEPALDHTKPKSLSNPGNDTADIQRQLCLKCASKTTLTGDIPAPYSTSTLATTVSASWTEENIRQLNLGSCSSTNLTDKTRWGVPESVQQVHALKKQVRKQPREQLELCRMLANRASLHQSDAYGSGTRDTNTDSLNHTMITTAKQLLEHLAKYSQRGGHKVKGESQFLLANSYGVGSLGLPVDYTAAYIWYTQASKQNHQEATYRAGVCHELGIGTKQDFRRAVKYYRKGASLGHPASMYKLAMILLRGRCGETKQPRAAVSWLQRAADAHSDNDPLPSSNSCLSCFSSLSSSSASSSSTNSLPLLRADTVIERCLPQAIHALAMIQLNDECGETSLVADTKYAIQLLHNAAQLGYGPSQWKLGQYYESGQQASDACSIYWYTLAAQKGEPEAALGLSCWYLTGSTVPNVLEQSDRKAFFWAQEAAITAVNRHDTTAAAKAFFIIGLYTEFGIGIPHSCVADAVVWYKKAADLGHRGARRRLAETYLPENLNESVDMTGITDATNAKEKTTCASGKTKGKTRDKKVCIIM